VYVDHGVKSRPSPETLFATRALVSGSNKASSDFRWYWCRRSGPSAPSMLICQRPYESSGGVALCAVVRPPDSASATATAVVRPGPRNPAS
jgi:hypothetical protein